MFNRHIARHAHQCGGIIASSVRGMASEAAAAAATPAAPTPATSTPWGPKSRLLVPSMPAPLPKRSPVVAGSPPPPPRRLPVKHSRLSDDNPNSKVEQFELVTAVIVERWPKVLREEPKWRTEYQKHFQQVRARKNKAHAIPKELQPTDAAPTVESDEPINPADLLTEADRANDLHATHRCLQDSLYLVLKRRGAPGWCFPSSVVPFDVLGWDAHVPDAAKVLAAATARDAAALLAPPPPKDTLRTVAATAISSTIGTHAGVYFMGNAPLAVHRVRKNMKPANAPTQPGPALVGTKTFFMHALYMDGEVRMQNAREYEDYAWVRKVDLPQYIGQEQAELLNTVLIEPEA